MQMKAPLQKSCISRRNPWHAYALWVGHRAGTVLTGLPLQRGRAAYVNATLRRALLAGLLSTFALQAGLVRPAEAAIGGAADLRQVASKGSIAAQSNQLTVSSASGFNVRDWVIVEIGNEAGQGRRGTRGVGGT